MGALPVHKGRDDVTSTIARNVTLGLGSWVTLLESDVKHRMITFIREI